MKAQSVLGDARDEVATLGNCTKKEGFSYSIISALKGFTYVKTVSKKGQKKDSGMSAE